MSVPCSELFKSMRQHCFLGVYLCSRTTSAHWFFFGINIIFLVILSTSPTVSYLDHCEVLFLKEVFCCGKIRSMKAAISLEYYPSQSHNFLKYTKTPHRMTDNKFLDDLGIDLWSGARRIPFWAAHDARFTVFPVSASK